jgi:PRTRC genetic system protein A
MVMMQPVGYLTNISQGLQGQRGFFYDYILARNGIFLEACSALLEARICLARVQVRGLAPLEEKLSLVKGKIPGSLYLEAISLLRSDPYREGYLALTWDQEYLLQRPDQVGNEDRVQYQVLPDTLMDIHSHGTDEAFFSSEWDDPDEQGFRLSLVVGKLHTLLLEIKMRLVMYGYYAPVSIEEIFDCIP